VTLTSVECGSTVVTINVQCTSQSGALELWRLATTDPSTIFSSSNGFNIALFGIASAVQNTYSPSASDTVDERGAIEGGNVGANVGVFVSIVAGVSGVVALMILAWWLRKKKSAVKVDDNVLNTKLKRPPRKRESRWARRRSSIRIAEYQKQQLQELGLTAAETGKGFQVEIKEAPTLSFENLSRGEETLQKERHRDDSFRQPSRSVSPSPSVFIPPDSGRHPGNGAVLNPSKIEPQRPRNPFAHDPGMRVPSPPSTSRRVSTPPSTSRRIPIPNLGKAMSNLRRVPSSRSSSARSSSRRSSGRRGMKLLATDI